jgi:hypothetical protein
MRFPQPNRRPIPKFAVRKGAVVQQQRSIMALLARAAQQRAR